MHADDNIVLTLLYDNTNADFIQTNSIDCNLPQAEPQQPATPNITTHQRRPIHATDRSTVLTRKHSLTRSAMRLPLSVWRRFSELSVERLKWFQSKFFRPQARETH